jgi:hypothetical protein
VVVLWVRSHRDGGSSFPRQPSPASTYLHSLRGVLRLRVCDRAHPETRSAAGMAVYRPLADEYELRAAAPAEGGLFERGLVHAVTRTDVRGRPSYPRELVPFWSVSIRHGHVLLITGALPVCWLVSVAWRQRQHREQHDRIRRGLCPACGYDLRVSPDRCPECGVMTRTAATAA